VTSAAEVPSLVLPCRAYKIRFGGHGSPSQRSWSCTTRASYQYSCMVWIAGWYLKTDACKIDALDQWCLRMLTGINWYQFVWNDDVQRLTKHPKLTANPVTPAYPVWAYYAHGWQRRYQEDPVSLPSGRLEKTTRSSPHHVAHHCPTGSETTPPYAPQSSRFGSEPPSVEDDVDVWLYAILRVACQKQRRRLCVNQQALLSKCTYMP